MTAFDPAPSGGGAGLGRKPAASSHVDPIILGPMHPFPGEPAALLLRKPRPSPSDREPSVPPDDAPPRDALGAGSHPLADSPGGNPAG